MNTFFKFTKTFNPYKFGTSLLFGSFVGFYGYQKTFMNQAPTEEYKKSLGEHLHQKAAS